MINAFAFRLRPSHIDKVEALLADNQIAIGWSKAEGLLTPGFSKEDFRKEVAHHYPDIVERNWVGQDVNHLWRFIREMKKGDIVVIPHDDDVHFVQVTSEAMYFANQANDDTAIRRDVVPLLGGKPINRASLPSALRKALEKKNFKVSNRRVGSLGPDLFTIEHKPPYLFEIKTGAGASDYLKGVGQLIVYQKALGEKHRKFLVIPQGLDSYAAQILQQLEIEVIEFSGEDPDYVFSWPKHF